MLNYNDLKQVQEVIKEETDPLKAKIEHIENNLDKVLKIVTTTQQELTIAASKFEEHTGNKAIHHTHPTKISPTPAIYA